MQRTIASLKIIKSKIQKHNIIKLRTVATESYSQASNSENFLARVNSETEVCFEII